MSDEDDWFDRIAEMHRDMPTREQVENLYANRTLLIFTHGRKWFIEQVNKLMPNRLPRLVPTANLNIQDYHRELWEIHNHFTATNQIDNNDPA